MGERIGPQLDVNGPGLGALARFLQPRRAVAIRAPESAPLPAGVRIVDAPIKTLGVEAHGVGDAQHHHLPVLEGDEAVIEVGGRDRAVLANSLEAGARILVDGEAFRAMVAGRLRPVERTLALTPIETD